MHSCLLLCVLLLVAASHASVIVLQEFVFVNNTKNAHASTIVELDRDTLAAAWFGGTGEGSDDTKIYFAIKYLNAWSAPQVVAEHKPMACWNPVLYYNGSELILHYKSGPHAYNWSGFIKRSSNRGKTWSSDQCTRYSITYLFTVLPGGIIGPAKNKCLQVNQYYMCPSSLESHFRDSAYIDYSTDWGKTWRKSTPIALIEYDMVQPTIWVSQRNTMRALIRSSSGYIVAAESLDLGFTWQEPRLTNLPNPNSGIDAVQLRQSGNIVLMYNDSQEKRTPLNIGLSTNDGESFKNAFVLENDPDCQFSYPSVIESKYTGLVHTVYTWVCPKQANNVRIKHVVIDPKAL